MNKSSKLLQNDTFTTSETIQLDKSENLKYFNSNYSSNSDDLSCQPIGPTITPTAITTTTGSSNTVVPYLGTSENSSASYIESTIFRQDEEMSSDNEKNEKTLAEIGFKTNKIPEWDKILQPKKPELMDLVHDMITNHRKTNVQIYINETSFKCHMLVLQCYSDFFMQLNNEQMIILPSEQVTPEAFAMVYNWMLAKEPKVQRDGILELFNAATFLKIEPLINQCWVCLDDDERFCEDAAFLLYLEARKYDHHSIQELMLTRICKFFLTLVASKEFLELSLEEICTLLKSNSIGVYSESEVLMSAVRWLHFNFPEREQHLSEIIKCVRFGLFAPWQLVELRRNKTSMEIQRIVDNIDVQNMIDDGLSYVTTRCYYVNREKDFQECLERLHLTEPVERQWLRDKSWSHHEHFPDKHLTTYETFLEYLDHVRNMGENHWKTLEFNEDIQFCDYYADVRNHKNYLHNDFNKLKMDLEI